MALHTASWPIRHLPPERQRSKHLPKPDTGRIHGVALRCDLEDQRVAAALLQQPGVACSGLQQAALKALGAVQAPRGPGQVTQAPHDAKGQVDAALRGILNETLAQTVTQTAAQATLHQKLAILERVAHMLAESASKRPVAPLGGTLQREQALGSGRTV